MGTCKTEANIRVMLVEEFELVRHGFKLLIESERDLTVVAEADNGRDAIKLFRKQRPNVVVMNIEMPNLCGISTSYRLRKIDPDVRIVSLSRCEKGPSLRGMVRAGVMGYVSKKSPPDELIDAIRAVHAGTVFISRRLAGAVIGNGNPRVPHNPSKELTPREREVLQFIVEGRTTLDVATELSVSTKTIETHRRNVMSKTGCRSLPCLTKYAIRENITSLN